jgi:hypothetical protein
MNHKVYYTDFFPLDENDFNNPFTSFKDITESISIVEKIYFRMVPAYHTELHTLLTGFYFFSQLITKNSP